MSLVIHRSKTDYVVDSVIYVGLSLFALATLFPILYVIVMSITPFSEVMSRGGFVIIPHNITFDAYKEIFASARIPQALKITVIITVLGTALNLFATLLLAYPLSKKFVPGRNFFLMAIVFTMLFSGGMIPTYLVVQSVGLLDTIWALILPGLVSAFNMLIVKTYFQGLPEEIEDAAKVDGCGDFQTMFRIVLPLSMPIIATIGLFYAVGHWNSFFAAILYIDSRELQPIQLVLRNMIQSPNVSQELQLMNSGLAQQLPPETMKMATVVVTIIPILLVYPFLQKYFVKGMVIGAVKG